MRARAWGFILFYFFFFLFSFPQPVGLDMSTPLPMVWHRFTWLLLSTTFLCIIYLKSNDANGLSRRKAPPWNSQPVASNLSSTPCSEFQADSFSSPRIFSIFRPTLTRQKSPSHYPASCTNAYIINNYFVIKFMTIIMIVLLILIFQ